MTKEQERTFNEYREFLENCPSDPDKISLLSELAKTAAVFYLPASIPKPTTFGLDEGYIENEKEAAAYVVPRWADYNVGRQMPYDNIILIHNDILQGVYSKDGIAVAYAKTDQFFYTINIQPESSVKQVIIGVALSEIVGNRLITIDPPKHYIEARWGLWYPAAICIMIDYINSRENQILEEKPLRPYKSRNRAIAPAEHRPKFTVIHKNRAKREIIRRTPTGTRVDTGKRGYWKPLRSAFYVNRRGETIWVRHHKPKIDSWEEDGKKYVIHFDR